MNYTNYGQNANSFKTIKKPKQTNQIGHSELHIQVMQYHET